MCYTNFVIRSWSREPEPEPVAGTVADSGQDWTGSTTLPAVLRIRHPFGGFFSNYEYFVVFSIGAAAALVWEYARGVGHTHRWPACGLSINTHHIVVINCIVAAPVRTYFSQSKVTSHCYVLHVRMLQRYACNTGTLQ